MTDIDSRIASIRRTIDSARVTKARAEAALEQAELSKSQAIEQLKLKFGLDNLADARAKLAKLRNDLDEKVSEIEDQLSKF